MSAKQTSIYVNKNKFTIVAKYFVSLKNVIGIIIIKFI